jgi:small subunit ribosomal protein S17
MVNAEARTNLRKERIGVVTSAKMQKTIVVRIFRKVRHPLYGKVIEKAAKFKVHDEKNEAKAGDRVQIIETRPLSREKCWRLVKVLSHGVSAASADLKDEFEPKPKSAPAAAPAKK